MDQKRQALLDKIPKIFGLDDMQQKMLTDLAITAEGAGFETVAARVAAALRAQQSVLEEIQKNGGDFEKIAQAAQKKAYTHSMVRRERDLKTTEAEGLEQLLCELDEVVEL